MHRYNQYPQNINTQVLNNNNNYHNQYGSGGGGNIGPIRGSNNNGLGNHPAQVPRSFSGPYYLRNSYYQPQQHQQHIPKSRSATSVHTINSGTIPPKNPPDRYHRRRSVSSNVIESSLESLKQDDNATMPTSHSTSSISKMAAKQATATTNRHQNHNTTNRPRPKTVDMSVTQKEDSKLNNNKVRSKSTNSISNTNGKSTTNRNSASIPPPLVLPSDVRRHSLASYSSTSLNSCLKSPHHDSSSSSSSPKIASSYNFNPPPSAPPSPTVTQSPTSIMKSNNNNRKMSNSSVVSSPPVINSSSASSIKRSSPLSQQTPPPPPPQPDHLINYTNNFSVISGPGENNNGKKSISTKLKKALSFGRGSSKNNNISDENNKTSPPSFTHRPRKSSIGAQSTKSAFVGKSDDTHSIMSTKSTASAVSLTSLKRMSKSLFSKNRPQPPVDEQQQPPMISPTSLMPNLNHDSTPDAGSTTNKSVSATPVLSHSIAEAEPVHHNLMVTPPPPPKFGFAGYAPPTPPPSSSDDCVTIRKSEESESYRPIPSLSSSATCSSDYEKPVQKLQQQHEVEVDESQVHDIVHHNHHHHEQEDGNDEGGDDNTTAEEDVTAVGDTVFPKKLDVVTVETIRSSLERTKSLERRRSKRSTRSEKSEGTEITTTKSSENRNNNTATNDEDEVETIPNPTEVHVHDENIPIDLNNNKDLPTPKSILKSAASSEQMNNNETDQEEQTDSKNVDLINFGVLDSDINLDFNFEKLPEVLPKQIEEEDMEGAQKEIEKQQQIQYQYQPIQYDNGTPMKSKMFHSFRRSSRSSSLRTSTSSDGYYYTVPPPQQQQQQQQANNKPNQVYHPLYQKRVSQQYTNHNKNNSTHYSTASASSSASSILSSTKQQQHQQENFKGHHHSNSSSGTVSFSSRIVIYDTYDSVDYDRRAELATCNRLTPLLAQQIKEELNNFKMEMDIHTDSRIYTHFF